MTVKHSQMRKASNQILSSNKSNRQIAREHDLAPNTVRRYRQILNESDLKVGDLEKMDDTHIRMLFQGRGVSISGKRMPNWEIIHSQMQFKHQVLLELWEPYRLIDPSDAYCYSEFTKHYRRYCAKVDISMRQNHIAGEVVFTDFCGKRISYQCPNSHEEKYAEVFVGCMGCSNYTFAYAVRSQTIIDWVETHNAMFQFFGGVPQVEVPDNLKSAVNKAGRFPELNRTNEDMADHYGITMIPARVRKPQDKAKAENAVRLITRWIINRLQKEKFFSIAEINVRISELLEAFNQRKFKRLPGNRKSRFYEFDKPLLQPLPAQPFEYAEWVTKQKVGPDYHIYVHNHAYSVPYSLVSEYVEARVSAKIVELFFNGKRITTHARDDTPGSHTTNPEHRPDKHRAYAEQTAEKFIKWSTAIGPMAQEIVQAQFEGKPDFSYAGRAACSQLQKLAKQYGNERFENACKRAAAIKSLTVTSIHSILKRKLDMATDDDIPIQPQLPLHQNIRGAEYFEGGRV